MPHMLHIPKQLRILYVFFLVLFFNINAFSITRNIECVSLQNPNEFLTIQLRGGIANIYTCFNISCSKSPTHDAFSKAVLMDDKAYPLLYTVIGGNVPAKKTLEISFGETLQAPVTVTIDGDSEMYSCH